MMIPNISPEAALLKFEQLQCHIASLSSQLIILSQWAAELEDVLEEETKPALLPPVAPTTRRIGRGFDYGGKHHDKWSFIDIYRSLLRRLFQDFPEKRDAMALAVRRNGCSRRYIARGRNDLFIGKSEEWVRRYSKPIDDEWYMDTNVNVITIRKKLIAAVRAAGLDWGTDVTVYWQTTVVPSN